MTNPAEAPEVINAFLRVLVVVVLYWKVSRSRTLREEARFLILGMGSVGLFAAWCMNDAGVTPGRDLYLVYQALLGEGE